MPWLSYLGAVWQDEAFRRIMLPVEQSLHVLLGQILQLCLANICQEIHWELHPCKGTESSVHTCGWPEITEILPSALYSHRFHL